MKRTVAIFGTAVLCLLVAAPASADRRFQATLVSSQEVPSNSSSARGTGTVLLNTAETEITVNMTFSGLTSNTTAAHIHGPAAAGTNAGILFDLSGGLPGGTSGTIPPQTFGISASQVTQLEAGQFYFNIHTTNFGGGEIRGQILTAPAQKFAGFLNGAQEVPPNSSTGTGTGSVLLSADETQIIVDLSFTGLSSNASAAHIHRTSDGGIVFGLSGVPVATSGSIPTQPFGIDATQLAQLKAGQLYFNIHTGNFPGGEIRGPILLAPTQRFGTTLAGWQEVPPNTTSATGTGTVLLSAAEDQIVVNLSFSGLTSNATAAHIHGPAAAGSNADVVFPLSGVPAAMSGSIPQQIFSISATQVGQLEAGQFYFNVHSVNLGGGEIRGQILLTPVKRFSVNLTGAQEVPPSASPGTGSGTVLLNGTEDQITANASFSNLTTNANAAHIHGPAPAGMDAGILFGFDSVPSATSGLIPEQSFGLSPGQVADLKASQHYINIHSTGFPGGEIRGQILAIPTLTATKAGNGTSNGTVTSSPAGITCGADCTEAYDSGTMVTLTAGAPAAGSFFAGWSGGGCSGTDPCAVTLTADTTVTATYSASAFTFTDDPLSAGTTPVKAAHVAELRTAINTLRSNNGLPASVFTDPTLTTGETPVKAVHVMELRSALNAVYAQRGLQPPTYTDPTLAAGDIVKRVHVAEIRAAARALE